MTPSDRRVEAGARALAVTGAVVAADQASKAAVVASVARGHTAQALPFLDLANVRNRGIAFGLFGSANSMLIAVTILILVGILAYLSQGGTGPRFWLSGGLLLGGAISNLADRVRIGSVIDWIDLPVWPTFNLADAAIVAGVLCLVLLSPDTGGEDP
ncbi:MAG: signal peptidase II [Solirubrobacterales bacterium]